MNIQFRRQQPERPGLISVFENTSAMAGGRGGSGRWWQRFHRPIGIAKSALPLVLGWAAFPAVALAQEVALPERQTSAAQGESLGDSLLISEAVGNTRSDVAEGVGEAVSAIEGGFAGRKGRWRIEPRLVIKGTYDDNIFIRRDNRVADYVGTLSPGLAFGFWDSVQARERDLDRLHAATAAVERSRGNFLIFDYTAILMGFSRTTSQNALDHDARFDTQWKTGKLTLGANVQFESKSETNNDVGGRLRRKTLSAGITSSYRFNEKLTLELGLRNATNRPEGFARTTEWRGDISLDYSVTPSARFGFGFAAGLLQVDRGADQVFQRVLARAGYSVSEKLDVEFRGGVEFRQSDGRSGNRTSPIFDVRTSWTPSAGTRLRVSTYRRVGTAIEEPEEFVATSGVSLAFLRALHGSLYLSIEGGYEVADYLSISREDKYFFVRPGLLYNFAKWGTASITYEYRCNDSNQTRSSYYNNQISFEIGCKY